MKSSHEEFFACLTNNITPKKRIKLILVTHILPDRPLFLKYLSKIVDIVGIIPKPNSINEDIMKIVKRKYNIINVTKEELKNPEIAIQTISDYVQDNNFIISDIGGYFASVIEDISKHFQNKFIGLIEDTENGHQKYVSFNSQPKVPIYSVARSELKYPEDILIGYSTVYSAEAVLRERDEILTGKTATVIGYGKIGQHMVRDLLAKKVLVSVYDNCKAKLVHALAEGHKITTKEHALENSDIIFCVTGNKSLSSDDFKKIKKNCYIFSITSSDDEFYIRNNFVDFEKKPFSPIGVTLINPQSNVHMVNYGNAANFLHGAVVGNFIFLVQAELMMSIHNLTKTRNHENGFHELDQRDKDIIADKWLKCFS